MVILSLYVVRAYMLACVRAYVHVILLLGKHYQVRVNVVSTSNGYRHIMTGVSSRHIN